VGDYTGFAEVNEFIYHSARSLFYDVVIWCLGPVVDDSRDYSVPRLWIASITYHVCRRVLRVHD
jgi:hypothetical protein